MKWSFIKGSLFMAIVIVIYVGTSLIISLTLDDEDEEQVESFNKPFFISYTA